MLLLVTLFAVWLGWQLKIVNHRREILRWLHAHGRQAMESNNGTRDRPDLSPSRWRQWMGDGHVELIIFDIDVYNPTWEECQRIEEAFPESEIVS